MNYNYPSNKEYCFAGFAGYTNANNQITSLQFLFLNDNLNMNAFPSNMFYEAP